MYGLVLMMMMTMMKVMTMMMMMEITEIMITISPFPFTAMVPLLVRAKPFGFKMLSMS